MDFFKSSVNTLNPLSFHGADNMLLVKICIFSGLPMDTHPYYSFFPNSVINISYQITLTEIFYTPPTVCASCGVFSSELQLVYIFLARAEIHIQKFNFGQKISNNYLVSIQNFQKDQDAGCMFTLSYFSEP
jgi:hypothetical protein